MRKKKLEVYVFPLSQVVFFSGISVPVQIFEDRYRRMFEEAAHLRIPVAMTLADSRTVESKQKGYTFDDFQKVAGYGIPVKIDRRGRGESLYLLRGEGKLELTEILEEVPFLKCKAQVISENKALDPANRRQLDILKSILFDWIRHQIHLRSQKKILLDQIRTPEEIVDCYASFLVSDAEMRQVLLELDDINQRLEYLTRMHINVV